jgi:Bacterial PH domain
MDCPFCKAAMKDEAAKFCPSCGRAIPPSNAMGAAASAPAYAPGGLLPQPGGAEVILFQGKPAVISTFGGLMLAIVTLGLAALVMWIQRGGTHYRITSQRIVIERGVFSKEMQQVDLYRVVDYVVKRSFGERILGTGTIVLETMDKTTAELRITGIRTDVMALYERLRAATEAEKRSRGVRVVDFERP